MRIYEYKATKEIRFERRGAAFHAAILRAIANPTRLQILESLLKGTRCVRDLSKSLGILQPNISQHLAELKSKGLVYSRRKGVERCYELTKPAHIRNLFQLMSHMGTLSESRAKAK